GSLGAGKTTLVQGICHGLGVTAWANSPTFTLINEYVGTRNGEPLRVYHCDFYRIDDPEELATLALDEVFYGDGVTLVEWPDVAEEWAPDDAVRVKITRIGANERRLLATLEDVGRRRSASSP
ncbi:MAG TPA: tRNA (adenosine(37)-N6)-threonylcarbamoyltransferase complex ATPase subunit type 1 TsaE, partial [Firmicutes bacterium]|nr:tRNA (adenosine(37)-N6)-threonylcarbamoyltransferase complex ATPase subunit type 1 TsaE [Bacillota bacterium]